MMRTRTTSQSSRVRKRYRLLFIFAVMGLF